MCTAKKVTLFSLAVLMAFCAGCGSKDTAKSRNKAVVVTLWHPWGGSQKEGLDKVVKEFNRTHPGIIVKALFTPNQSGINQKFFTAIAANKAPDMTFVDGTQPSAWAEQGAIVPLDKFVKKDGIKRSDFFTPCWEQNYYKGHVWAMTYCADPNFAFVWNKKSFRDAGLDPEKPPTTVEELDKYNDILTIVKGGNIIQLGCLPFGAYGVENSIYTWGWAFGGSFYDPKTMKITADDPKVVEALEWMISYSKKYDLRKINSFSSGFGTLDQDPFFLGKLTMKCLHISEIELIKKYAPNLDYGITFLPAPRGGEEHSSWVGGWCLSIPKGSKHPKAAWEFIKWCCADPKGTSIVGRRQSLLPGYRYSPYFKEIENQPEFGCMLQILRESKHQRPVMPAQSFYMNALSKAGDYAIYGKMTPRQALKQAGTETQTELDLRLAGR